MSDGREALFVSKRLDEGIGSTEFAAFQSVTAWNASQRAVRRDRVIVARQFIAWNTPIENPSRRARSDPYPWLIRRPDHGAPVGPNHTVPYGTVPFLRGTRQ